jgi:catechol 2,3-dioxygenase-like lactoylglutathione lyase family enzyme
MTFEHYALNVPDPQAMADWYCTHCGMTAEVAMTESPFMHFLADASGRVVVEIYHNPTQRVPDYATQHPLLFHHAFAVADAAAERDRLIAAGATHFEDVHLPDGGELVMLRDPWGIPLQLCARATPMQ